jgi:hypothetical protein
MTRARVRRRMGGNPSIISCVCTTGQANIHRMNCQLHKRIMQDFQNNNYNNSNLLIYPLMRKLESNPALDLHFYLLGNPIQHTQFCHSWKTGTINGLDRSVMLDKMIDHKKESSMDRTTAQQNYRFLLNIHAKQTMIRHVYFGKHCNPDFKTKLFKTQSVQAMLLVYVFSLLM